MVLFNKQLKELVQVTYAQSLVDIPEREIKALLKAAKALNFSSGTVITWDVEESRKVNGVTISYIPLWKWLALSF